MNKITVFGYLFAEGKVVLDCDVEVHGGLYCFNPTTINESLWLTSLKLDNFNKAYSLSKDLGLDSPSDKWREVIKVLTEGEKKG